MMDDRSGVSFDISVLELDERNRKSNLSNVSENDCMVPQIDQTNEFPGEYPALEELP